MNMIKYTCITEFRRPRRKVGDPHFSYLESNFFVGEKLRNEK
jgi:hypothetical protein